MVNVLLAVGRGYARQGRRLFHQACAAQAKAKCRREAGSILLITGAVALGFFIWTRDTGVLLVVGVIGGLIALLTFFSYS
jgi:hypothetical protein